MSWPTLPQYFKDKAALYGDRVFLRHWTGEVEHTYRQTDDLTDRLAGGLRRLGLRSGERVALLHPNHPDFILAYLAVAKAGAVTVPVNPLYTPREILHLVEDSGASFLVTTEALAGGLDGVRGSATGLGRVLVKGSGETLEQCLAREAGRLEPFAAEDRGPDDPVFFFYTSGTTGRPKGVVLTHRNLTFGGANTAQNYGLRETDVALACLPLVHIFANASPVFGTLNSGGCVVTLERFQTESAFATIERHRVTWFPGVPTMFGYLLGAFGDAPRDLTSLRMGLSGGASLSAAHLRRFESLFGVPVLEVYGLTESTGLVTGNPVYGVRKAGSIGISVSGVTVRLVDDEGREVPRGEAGELAFRGPNGTAGYWNLPEATERLLRGGWVHTGDLVRQDEDGYFFLAGRKDELIVSGGYNIYPREVEEVLYLSDDVAEAAVVGTPDPDLGEAVKAFVVLKTGSRAAPTDLAAFCRSRLAAYKVPRVVELLAELPKNSTGKIQKNALPRA